MNACVILSVLVLLLSIIVFKFFNKSYPLVLASYNITASFHSDPKHLKDPKQQFPQHWWWNRRKYFKEAINKVSANVIGLQELSPEQALYFMETFSNHKFYIFTQTGSIDGVKAGQIYTTPKEIRENLIGKDIGTTLLGIMFDPRTLEPSTHNPGMFWYNSDPFKIPTSIDRTETDKGFGNMNTNRAVGYVEFTHIQSGRNFYFFVSHAPISGGTQTRKLCFELELKMIKEITNGIDWFSAGDRNMFPGAGYDEMYNALVGNGAHDWMNVTNHIGPKCTWIGYSYEPMQFQNQIQNNGTFTMPDRLDVGISSLKSVWSAHFPCIIRNDEVSLYCKLNWNDDATRNYLSDHMMLVACFGLKKNIKKTIIIIVKQLLKFFL